MQRIAGWAEQGAQAAVTQGLTSTAALQGTFALAAIEVYLAGTTTHPSAIYSDDASPPTVLGNPFTASADGYWYFYAPNGVYDVKITPVGGVAFTLGGFTAGSGDAGLVGYAKASLPTSGQAANAGRLARVTDTARGVWMDTGSQWVSLNGQVLHVTEFGAVGDGSTDDTAAIQAALDAAHALPQGGSVLFDPLIYRLSGLTWYDNVSLVGTATIGMTTGDTLGTILRSNAAAAMLTLSPTSLQYHRGIIRDITFDGDSLGTYGAVLNNLAWLQMQRAYFYNFVTTGLKLRGVLTSVFTGCQIRNCVVGIDGDQDPTTLNGSNLCTFRDCIISANTTYGVQFQHSGLVQFLSCDIESNGTAANAATGGMKFANMCLSGEGIAAIVAGCWLENNSGYAGIRCDPGSFSSGCLHIIRDTEIFSGTRTYGLAFPGGANSTTYLAEGVICQNAGTADIYEGAANVQGTLVNCGASTASLQTLSTAIPNPVTGSGLILHGYPVTYGANDSGGTGYKVLRVPNAAV